MTDHDGLDLEGATLTEVSLRGARLTDCDLSGVVMRVDRARATSTSTPRGSSRTTTTVLVNGVDVVPFVRAELERRFPGRALMTAATADGLRAAWAACEAAWDAVLVRTASLPAGAVDVRVDGEWSLAQTLRHLVLATDLWLRGAVLGVEQPLHPLGLADASAGAAGLDTSVFSTRTPTWDEVLAARADRVAAVRAVVADVDDGDLSRSCRNPWSPDRPVTVLSCLHTVLHEEWEHLRFAVRDLDAVTAVDVQHG